MPEYHDKKKMVRILREDDEFLDAMLADERVIRRLLGDEDLLTAISARLYFSVLLLKVKRELGNRAYTVEKDTHHLTPVFDSGEVVELLSKKSILRYLAVLLASFVRTESYTIPVRVRRGVWYKIRFSDFDVDRLIRYSELLAEENRFRSYKRIADVCLFMRGVFPENLKRGGGDASLPQSHFGKARLRGRMEYEDLGRRFYRLASDQREADVAGLKEVLSDLATKFKLAAKPLTFMARHYFAQGDSTS
jgi:hypothetical protein